MSDTEGRTDRDEIHRRIGELEEEIDRLKLRKEQLKHQLREGRDDE